MPEINYEEYAKQYYNGEYIVARVEDYGIAITALGHVWHFTNDWYGNPDYEYLCDHGDCFVR